MVPARIIEKHFYFLHFFKRFKIKRQLTIFPVKESSTGKATTVEALTATALSATFNADVANT